jgi:hypothetical protein
MSFLLLQGPLGWLSDAMWHEGNIKMYIYIYIYLQLITSLPHLLQFFLEKI